ncbi:hypothetical protein TNCT_336631 [Trichonephila clavata]|uniref:Uncharacterized protein n=1 Tax=Trichonephila clavata TaxID=2740835 RepID=A0A8X6LAD4_TRICU|nr:hypothetical protein TNCT_336631 [Trichonephila clavata]
MPDFNAFYESFFSDLGQEEEPMDWEDVPVKLFLPPRSPRKMRSLISLQVLFSFSQPLPEHEGSRSKDCTIDEKECFFTLPGQSSAIVEEGSLEEPK